MPTIVKINPDTPAARLEVRDGRLYIPVTLRGPRALLEGDALEATRSKIRAYVRVDGPSLVEVADSHLMRVYFEGVPEGIVAEEIALMNRPVADAVPFK